MTTYSTPEDAASETLAWARREVLDLVDRLVLAVDTDDFAAVSGRLARLANDTVDPSRRLALLLQLSIAIAGTVDVAETRRGVDRERLVADLAPAMRNCLHEPRGNGRCSTAAA
jgi:hypothetical protein